MKTIFFIFFIFLVFGCKNISKVEKQELRVSFQCNEVPSYNPIFSQDCASLTLGKALFEGLTRIDGKGDPSLALAESIHVSPCKTVYTIFLRPSTWSNGEKVTAFHFINAWKNVLLPESKAYKVQNFFIIKNAEKIYKKQLPMEDLGVLVENENKIVIHLEHPAPYFLQLLADPIYSPVYDKKDIPTVFNGPFVLDKKTNHSQVVLAANARYWERASVKLQKIFIHLISNIDTAFMLYENGKLDWMGAPFNSIPQQVINSSKLKKLISHPICSPYWLRCNTERGLLKSKKIRKALAYAMDRTEIAQNVLVGQFSNKSVLPNEISQISESEMYQDKNYAVATKLFEEGLKELQIKKENAVIHFSHSDIPIQEKLAEYLQHHWENVFKVAVKLKKSDWNTFLQNLRNCNYEIGGAYAICTFKDPMCFLERFEYAESLSNCTKWENKTYQSYLQNARLAIDEDRRADLLKQAEVLFLEEMPLIPVYNFTYQYLKNESLQNLYLSDLGYVDFKSTYFN